ncbi:MAG: DUF1573 domain-containing protein [Planctomycetota bacterium]
MRRLERFAVLAGLAISVFLSETRPSSAQEWIPTVFPDKTYDFGTVAKGSKLRHSFKVVNSTDKEIHISGYRTKCGCTEVKIGADTIPPGTQTTIEATLDTTKFQGVKASGLTLIVDRPSFTEIDLNMNCFIRGDVLLTPGQVDFGQVTRTDGPSQVLTFQYLGGNPDFKITGSHHISPRLKVRVTEQNRSVGQVNYQLNATLTADSKLGFYKDQITLKTNDPASPEIPIFVTAQIQGLLTASPSVLNLGTVAKGASVQKTVIIKSDKPFKLTETKSSKGEVSAKPNSATANQSVQTLTITYKAPAQAGPDHAILELTSDISNEPPAKVNFFATVGP